MKHRNRRAFTKPTVFKIQTPIVSNDPDPKAFVYNEDRSWEGAVPIGHVAHHMGCDVKAFFLCRIHRPTGKIDIGKRVEDPGW